VHVDVGLGPEPGRRAAAELHLDVAAPAHHLVHHALDLLEELVERVVVAASFHTTRRRATDINHSTAPRDPRTAEVLTDTSD
jgi:hypothetical protein